MTVAFRPLAPEDRQTIATGIVGHEKARLGSPLVTRNGLQRRYGYGRFGRNISFGRGSSEYGELGRASEPVGCCPECKYQSNNGNYRSRTGVANWHSNAPMLRAVIPDMQCYDVFYKKLINAVPLKSVTSRFAMEKVKSITALPSPALMTE